MVRKRALWGTGIIAAILLIGSFPLRELYGEMSCDISRLIGFVFLILFTVLKLQLQNDKNQ